MTDLTTTNRPLAGATKQYLDDLLTLNAKVTDEMQRGIREGYLDVDGATALARELGVEPPRVKRKFRMYFERTSVYSMQVEAYDEDEAEQQARELVRHNIGRTTILYGSQTTFRSDRPGSGGSRHRYSVISRQRPELDRPIEVHPSIVAQGESLREAWQQREEREASGTNIVF